MFVYKGDEKEGAFRGSGGEPASLSTNEQGAASKTATSTPTGLPATKNKRRNHTPDCNLLVPAFIRGGPEHSTCTVPDVDGDDGDDGVYGQEEVEIQVYRVQSGRWQVDVLTNWREDASAPHQFVEQTIELTEGCVGVMLYKKAQKSKKEQKSGWSDKCLLAKVGFMDRFPDFVGSDWVDKVRPNPQKGGSFGPLCRACVGFLQAQSADAGGIYIVRRCCLGWWMVLTGEAVGRVGIRALLAGSQTGLLKFLVKHMMKCKKGARVAKADEIVRFFDTKLLDSNKALPDAIGAVGTTRLATTIDNEQVRFE